MASCQRRVDMRAPVADLGQRRPAKHAAPGPRVALALTLVIAVEQISVAFVERLVSGRMVAQHERLEKPSGVGQMPFGRRGVGAGLDRSVGVRQRRGEIEAQRAHPRQPPAERRLVYRVEPGCHNMSPPSVRAIQRAITKR